MAHTHPEGSVLKDPVCGMTAKPDTPHRAMHNGHELFFCSAGCKTKFQAEPGRYLKPMAKTEHSCCSADGAKVAHVGGQAAESHHHLHSHAPSPAPAAASAPAGAKWTCPMHPEIVRDGPGSCPICGMSTAVGFQASAAE
jgi:Cu+-exporting ATPase